MSISKLEELEDTAKATQTPDEEAKDKLVYRRRGSDLSFAPTKTNKVVVTRVNHRFKTSKHFVHEPAFIEENKEAIKKLLIEGGYKLVARGEEVAEGG